MTQGTMSAIRNKNTGQPIRVFSFGPDLISCLPRKARDIGCCRDRLEGISYRGFLNVRQKQKLGWGRRPLQRRYILNPHPRASLTCRATKPAFARYRNGGVAKKTSHRSASKALVR